MDYYWHREIIRRIAEAGPEIRISEEFLHELTAGSPLGAIRPSFMGEEPVGSLLCLKTDAGMKIYRIESYDFATMTYMCRWPD